MGDRVVTPRALGHLCTKRVITMTFLEGPTFSKIIHQQEKMQEGEEDREINLDGFKPKLLLGHLIESYGQQIFVEEVFHSDPHPGNLVWLKNDRLGLIDFGECKELRELDLNLCTSLISLPDLSGLVHLQIYGLPDYMKPWEEGGRKFYLSRSARNSIDGLRMQGKHPQAFKEGAVARKQKSAARRIQADWRAHQRLQEDC